LGVTARLEEAAEKLAAPAIFSDLAAPFGCAQGRLELVPFPNRLGDLGIKINVKGSGQECPLHTSKG
jgi:hypothetical protein